MKLLCIIDRKTVTEAYKTFEKSMKPKEEVIREWVAKGIRFTGNNMIY